jgi:hypothetical protein
MAPLPAVVPCLRRPGADAALVASRCGPELEYPPSDCLIGEIEISLGQQLLNIAMAQSEAQMEPYNMPDDLGRELVTGQEIGCMPLPYPSALHTVKGLVTTPPGPIWDHLSPPS